MALAVVLLVLGLWIGCTVPAYRSCYRRGGTPLTDAWRRVVCLRDGAVLR